MTEDTNTDPLKALLWSNGFREDDTEIASYAGCTNVESALVLGAFVKERAPNLKLVIHRDSDYMSGDRATQFVSRLTASGIAAFITEPSDIEGYFITADHLAHLNPGLTVEVGQALIDRATADAEPASITAIVNQRTEAAFRSRREGKSSVNHGEISVTAHNDYAADPARMRRGKEVLRTLAGLIQSEIGANPRIFFASPFLRSSALKGIADSIWTDASV